MKRTLLTIVLTILMLAPAIAIGMYLTVKYDNAVQRTQIEGEATVERGGVAGYVLNLHFKVQGHNPCASQTQNWAERPEAWLIAHGRTEPVLRPIAVTVNGLAPQHGTRDYNVRFDLPLNIEAGPWLYVARASYRCEWLPGIERSQTLQYDPVPFVVPEP